MLHEEGAAKTPPHTALAMVDARITGSDHTALELALLLVERRALYRHGRAGAFVAESAVLLGMSERQVRQLAQIGGGFTEAAARRVEGTILANRVSELTRIAAHHNQAGQLAMIAALREANLRTTERPYGVGKSTRSGGGRVVSNVWYDRLTGVARAIDLLDVQRGIRATIAAWSPEARQRALVALRNQIARLAVWEAALTEEQCRDRKAD